MFLVAYILVRRANISSLLLTMAEPWLFSTGFCSVLVVKNCWVECVFLWYFLDTTVNVYTFLFDVLGGGVRETRTIYFAYGPGTDLLRHCMCFINKLNIEQGKIIFKVYLGHNDQA